MAAPLPLQPDPSDLNLPHPTAAESALNPTRTIQYEFQHFLQQYRTTDIRRESDTPGTPFFIRMDAGENNPNFICTRDSFYLSLIQYDPIMAQPAPASIQRLYRCAQQGVPDIQGDPVDAAIHAYSKLISNLLQANRQPDASTIIEFLKIDYADAMSDPRSRTLYYRNKFRILIFFGENALVRGPDSALSVSPQIFNELVGLLYNTFTNEQRYIGSSPMTKQLISKFVVHGNPHMVQAYGLVTPLTKSHFFIYILNTPANHGDVSRAMLREIENELINPASQLNVLLNSNLYPIASNVAIRILQAVQRRRQPLKIAPAAGGSRQKRTLRNIKSKSYSKKINKTNKKKTRRSRRSFLVK
jgi:hypothetical protein